MGARLDEQGASLGGCGRRRGASRPWLTKAWGGGERELQAWRAGWECDCEGPVPLRLSALDHSKGQAARAIAKSIGAECGTEPSQCPHRGYDDPLTVAVLDAYRIARVGDSVNLAQFAALNPPELLFQALVAYTRAVDRAIAARRRREDAAHAARNASRAAHKRR